MKAAIRTAVAVIWLALLGALWSTPRAAVAAPDPCDGVLVEATHARKARYAPLVVGTMGNQFKPAEVRFVAILESGAWSAAYVGTPVSDDGVMFFETVGGTMRFRDAWGGWADPSDKPELVAWAENLGAPAGMAKCFAEVVAGE